MAFMAFGLVSTAMVPGPPGIGGGMISVGAAGVPTFIGITRTGWLLV